MEDAFDLIRIQNEVPGGGHQPRAVLSPLVVLLTVSAWERFTYNLGRAVDVKLRAKETTGYLRPNTKEGHKTMKIVHAASEGAPDGMRLPDSWRISVFDSAKGKSQYKPVILTGDESGLEELGNRFDGNVQLRNGIAHRVVGERMLGPDDRDAVFLFRTDAGEIRGGETPEDAGATVNQSIARGIFIEYMQLIDQTIAAVATAHDLEKAVMKAIRLPPEWFTDSGSIPDIPAGGLWGGTQIARW